MGHGVQRLCQVFLYGYRNAAARLVTILAKNMVCVE